VDEFCRLCKTAADLKLEDREIERLHDNIPADEKFCVRHGSRYVRKDLIGQPFYTVLINGQKGKPIYYPSVSEIDELWDYNYPASDPVYAMARKALVEEMGLSETEAADDLVLIFDELSLGWKIADVVKDLQENGLDISDQKAVETITALLVMLNNHTRMAINRGNRPADLSQPDAAATAARLRQNPAQNKPKIYPNDPCPCGSGKKYKKCCGRGK